MKDRPVRYMVALALLTAITVIPLSAVYPAASAQQGSRISISTDKSEYDVDQTITVTGVVEDVRPEDRPVLRAFFPSGELYRIDSVDVSADGRYTYELRIGGPQATVGIYRLVINYANEEAETSILVTTGLPMTCQDYSFHPNNSLWRTFMAGNSTYRINYLVFGATLSGLSADQDRKSLVAELSSAQGGCLVIALPEAVIAAENHNFSVNVDNRPAQFREIEENLNGTRVLHIDFGSGASRVEIIGTRVVPEFSAMFAIVVAGTISLVIAVSRYLPQMFKN